MYETYDFMCWLESRHDVKTAYPDPPAVESIKNTIGIGSSEALSAKSESAGFLTAVRDFFVGIFEPFWSHSSDVEKCVYDELAFALLNPKGYKGAQLEFVSSGAAAEIRLTVLTSDNEVIVHEPIVTHSHTVVATLSDELKRKGRRRFKHEHIDWNYSMVK